MPVHQVLSRVLLIQSMSTPVHEHTICQFAADLSASVGWGTIRSYLSAVRFYQISAGLPDPALAALPMLSYVLKGIHRKIPDSTRSKRLPITPHLLRKMHACSLVPRPCSGRSTTPCSGQLAAWGSLGL